MAQTSPKPGNVLIQDFMPLVKREVNGAANGTITSAIIQAMREFCSLSHIWKSTLPAITTIKNVKSYELEPPDQSVIVNILSMRHRDTIITSITEDELDGRTTSFWTSSGDNWRLEAGEVARNFVMLSPTLARLVPFPSTTTKNGLNDIRVVIKPKNNATEVAEFLFNDYSEAISYGAIARMTKIPSKVWTNFDVSAFNERYFQSDVAKARARARQGYSRAEMRVELRNLPFAGP